jgi:hypothetical protein
MDNAFNYKHKEISKLTDGRPSRKKSRRSDNQQILCLLQNPMVEYEKPAYIFYF